MSTFQPADNLRSRTFLGLLVAQFLAAFNDQAIHASAMFFAINKQALNEAQAISLMPILFYAPWALFCTLAGYFADRFSKRDSLVFWKIVEIAITFVALLGFWLGTRGNSAGPWVVLSTVFLMGMHSAFFVPAKYGAMPEILQPHMLSRGNGVLESLSFLAVILGTVCGGILSDVFSGREYLIGVVLVVLALIGAIASLLISRMPAANPNRSFPPYLYQPLYENVRSLLRSRPLAFAVIGIAFFTFIVAFMRATVYMHGEVQSPRWTESQTSEIVGMVALGIGLGSPFVGFLSGGKVELGLVPIGAFGMVIATLVAAGTLSYVPGLIACIILIGFFTGFYIVPLFTLLQHRAPKTSKGDSIATSNLINVTGAIAASLVVFSADIGARATGIIPEVEQRLRAIGTLASDPIYQDGRPIRMVFQARRVCTGPLKADESDRENRVGNARIDPLPEGLQRGDWVAESVYEVDGVEHHAFRRLPLPNMPLKGPHGDRAPAGQRDVAAGELAEDPVYRDGQPYCVLIATRVLEAREGRKFHHVINVPEEGDILIDPFKAGLKKGDLVVETTYLVDKAENVLHHRLRREDEQPAPVYDRRPLPRLLFGGAAMMTLFTLLLLSREMPDLFLRTVLWFHIRGNYRLNLYGVNNLPGNGPVILACNADRLEGGLHVLAATDRTTRFVFMQAADERGPGFMLRLFAVGSILLRLPEKSAINYGTGWQDKLTKVLERNEVLGLPLPDPEEDVVRASAVNEMYSTVIARMPVPVVPVYYELGKRTGKDVPTAYIYFGTPLPAGVRLDDVRQTVQQLGNEFHEQVRNGTLEQAILTAAH